MSWLVLLNQRVLHWAAVESKTEFFWVQYGFRARFPFNQAVIEDRIYIYGTRMVIFKKCEAQGNNRCIY
jgi:hypothetical protein